MLSIGKIFGVFQISGSGLSAQRRNLEVRAENIANAESFDAQTGQPYIPKEINFEAVNNGFELSNRKSRLSLFRNSRFHFSNLSPRPPFRNDEHGVRANVVQSTVERTKLVYAPDNPNANEDGYVEVPDVNAIGEMVELMAAARAYEANATVINAAKDMFKKALDI